MTIKQFDFIEGLIKKKDYDIENSLVQAFNSGYVLSAQDASMLIDYLLKCESSKEQEDEELIAKFTVGEKVKVYDDFDEEMIVEIAGVKISEDYRGVTHIEYEIYLEEYGEEVLFYEDEIHKL